MLTIAVDAMGGDDAPRVGEFGVAVWNMRTQLLLLLTLLLGQLLSCHDRGPGLFGEQFVGGMHGWDLR